MHGNSKVSFGKHQVNKKRIHYNFMRNLNFLNQENLVVLFNKFKTILIQTFA